MKVYTVGIALLALALKCPVHGQVTDKAEQSQIMACSTLDGPACLVAKSCAYCRSRWGESKCISANQRSTMPAGKFDCLQAFLSYFIFENYSVHKTSISAEPDLPLIYGGLTLLLRHPCSHFVLVCHTRNPV